MYFATPPMHHQHQQQQRRGNEEQQHYELTQYTPMGIQHFSSQYRTDPKALEKLSKRICARVEQDSSELITFCDRRIRKRRKKQKLLADDDEQQMPQPKNYRKKKQHKQQQQHNEEESAPAPEVISASDLVLGACLGQGSFSSVFVLEKHLYRKPLSQTAPRRGRRSKISRMDGTNQGSSHNRSTSNRGRSLFGSDNNNKSVSNHGSLRRRLRQRTSINDGSQRSHSNKSQRSRSMDPTPTRSHNQKDYTPFSTKELQGTPNSQQEGPIKVRRSSLTNENNTSRRSRSLSASIQKGIRAVFKGKSYDEEDEPNECFSPGKTTKQKSKSHHARLQYEDDENENNSGRGFFRGGSRSLSCHGRRRSRRSRSRGDKNERRRGASADAATVDTRSTDDASFKSSHNKTVLVNSCDETSNPDSNLVVKILQPKLMAQPKLFANCAAGLIREGLFLAAIDHPHVLKVHAWTSPNGWMDFAALSRKEGDLYDGYLLVLERLKGGSLKGWMRKWQQEHAAEERALAAEEQKRLEASQQRRLGRPRRLSLTSSSTESNSISIATSFSSNNNRTSSSRIRHMVQKRRVSMSHTEEQSAPQSYSESTCASSLFDKRPFPYTNKWPRTQLSDRMSILMQLSDTVKYLHKHRILHRDLKPDNLGVSFVDPHSNSSKQKQYPSSLSLKVFDFDIARLVPEDPREVSDLSILSKKKKKRRPSTGSLHSFDAEVVNNCSNRNGRSMSPFRSSSSLTGGDPSGHKRTKKYRGQRPRPGASQVEMNNVPSVISTSAPQEESVRGGRGEDTLFEMTAKMGSPRYMAPEIARGEPYNLKSEVYTVTLLVHEVLTLQKPYEELAPEDHGKLVHFDLPGYRPPIFSEWKWPAELEDALHKGFGDITQRPSMKELHSVLKKALPKLCPELLPTKTTEAASPATATTGASTPPSADTDVLSTKPLTQTPLKEPKKKARSLFHRSPIKSLSKRATRSSSLTPTASNSDFSLSNEEPLVVDVVQG